VVQSTDFSLKLNILKGNYFQQKFGIILESKMFENWSRKKWLPKLIFLNEKKVMGF
jgi:hypothetical protein